MKSDLELLKVHQYSIIRDQQNGPVRAIELRGSTAHREVTVSLPGDSVPLLATILNDLGIVKWPKA